MRRADRLFDIIQMLRVAVQPITAALIAERLEVTVRTVYRDMATLQARRIPIEGAPGLGYLLRRGFDLPPLMFTADEVDAIAVGARLVRRLRDPGLQSAAESVLAKVTTALPDALRSGIMEPTFLVSSGSAAMPDGVDLSDLRRAIRETRKVRIAYSRRGGKTKRTYRVAYRDGLLRRRDCVRRVVRAAKRLSPLSGRADRHGIGSERSDTRGWAAFDGTLVCPATREGIGCVTFPSSAPRKRQRAVPLSGVQEGFASRLRRRSAPCWCLSAPSPGLDAIIASVAKIPPFAGRQRKLDCFVARAPRNDGKQFDDRFSQALRSVFTLSMMLPKIPLGRKMMKTTSSTP